MQIQENGFQYPAPGSPQEWYELGVVLRRREMFGEAVNAFREAERLAAHALAEQKPDTGEMEQLRARAVVSIELIQSIRGFVNKDLMNP